MTTKTQRHKEEQNQQASSPNGANRSSEAQVETLLRIFGAQLLTYLKITGKRLGLLINFNVAVLKDGIKRIAL